VDGLRHIFQPSINYVYVPTPSQQRYDLPQFDYEQPGYRLLPIDYPDYNAIDSVDSQNTMRLGLRNKLQTKRESGIENLVNWALYTDWRLNPHPDQGTFANYFSYLDFSPRSWLSLSQITRYDVESLQLKEITHRLTIMPNDIWSFQIGNRYLRNDPMLGKNSAQNLYFTTFYLRFNENYGLRTIHHFDARQGKLQEQTYTIYRDLRSWTASLNFRIRSDQGQDTDYHVNVKFSFKVFPRATRGSDSLSHSWLIDG
jgi:LPS-assembly protein